MRETWPIAHVVAPYGVYICSLGRDRVCARVMMCVCTNDHLCTNGYVRVCMCVYTQVVMCVYTNETWPLLTGGHHVS